MDRFQKAALFGSNLGKIAFLKASEAPTIGDQYPELNSQAWRLGMNNTGPHSMREPKGLHEYMNPEYYGGAHVGPYMKGPSWVNGPVDKRIPFWKQQNVVDSVKPTYSPSQGQNPSDSYMRNLRSNVTTQYGKFPKDKVPPMR